MEFIGTQAAGPVYWEDTLKQEDTQQRLAANVFRGIALGH